MNEEHKRSEDIQRTSYEDVVPSDWAANFNGMCDMSFENHVNKGFHTETLTLPHYVGMIVSELGEAIEADRTVTLNKQSPVLSDKIPGFTLVEEEMADAVLRIMDYAGLNRLRLGEAIIAKHRYNTTRPFKHGKKY